MSEGSVATGAAMLDAANTGTPAPVADVSPPVNTPQQPSNTPPAAPVQTPVAYAKQLEQIPEALRPMVEPTFKEWDANVNRRFDEVHSRYAPYKEFIDAGLQPGQLREAVDLMKMVVQDPRRIYEALGEHLGITPQQAAQVLSGQGQVDEPDEFDLGETEEAQQYNLENDPRFQHYAQQQEQITQMLQQQQTQAVQAEADQWIESRISETTKMLESKGIEPDWDYILGVAGALSQSGRVPDNDQAFDQAVQSYITKVDSWRGRPTAGSNAPLVMPTNGGTPSTGLPPMDTAKDRRALGAELLQAAFRNG